MNTDNINSLDSEEIKFLDNLSITFRQNTERKAIIKAVEGKISHSNFSKTNKISHLNPFIKISLIVIVIISSVLGIYLGFIKNTDKNTILNQNSNSSIKNVPNGLIKINESSSGSSIQNKNDTTLSYKNNPPINKEVKKKKRKLPSGPIKGLPLKPHEKKTSLPE
jgi:hypothetical protein